MWTAKIKHPNRCQFKRAGHNMERMKGYSGDQYSVCVCVWIAVRKAVVFREFPSEEKKNNYLSPFLLLNNMLP